MGLNFRGQIVQSLKWQINGFIPQIAEDSFHATVKLPSLELDENSCSVLCQIQAFAGMEIEVSFTGASLLRRRAELATQRFLVGEESLRDELRASAQEATLVLDRPVFFGVMPLIWLSFCLFDVCICAYTRTHVPPTYLHICLPTYTHPSTRYLPTNPPTHSVPTHPPTYLNLCTD